MDVIITIIGIAGAAGLLSAYFFLSSGRLSNDRPSYHLLNFFSSLCLDIQAIYAGILPFVVINTAWCIISVYGLIRIRLDSQKKGS